MKSKLFSQKPQYIVDDQGKRKSVVFDIKDFEKFMEEIEDIYFGTLAEKEFKAHKGTMKHTDVKKLVKNTKNKN